MARVLTGIQSSGNIHLGNILGAIEPAIALSKNSANEAFFFIADLHSLTSNKSAEARIESVRNVAAAWLAFGLDTEKNTFYRQSDIPEVCELTWYLNCFTPFPMLANAHSFKDKSENLADVNAGLFSYPVLMAADILMYNAEEVPVGKDQKQHLEITRDIAKKFNNTYGEVFVIPESKIDERVMVVPGTDGRKMSKSYNNYIDIFLPDKKLRKQIMAIVTDEKTLEEPKEPSTCNVFAMYKLLANDGQLSEMETNYRNGNYGYGHAKQALFELIIEQYDVQRKRFWELTEQPELIEAELQKGAEKARKVGLEVLANVKKHLGY
jgi:tryptophanyl-tRNA synthetase